LNFAPPQKSSKFVDESTTLPLHTSKMLDGLHKLLPLLLHTHKKQNDKKKNRIGLFIPRPGQLWCFFPIFVVFSSILRKKRAFFSAQKIGKPKKSCFSDFAD
jgi:hypothetical protein